MTRIPPSSFGSMFTMFAAALASIAAVAILSAIVMLFQSEGTPLQHVVAAERACAAATYVSERQACMDAVLAARAGRQVAGK